MSARKQMLAYTLIALVFLALLGVIIWLVSVILHFRIQSPETTTPPLSAISRYSPSPGPVGEMLIRIDDDESAAITTPPLDEDGIAAAPGIPAHGHGHIPAACEGYGAQVQGRKAFKNPLTHQVSVSPARTTISLNHRTEEP